jgi:hypothetical protein
MVIIIKTLPSPPEEMSQGSLGLMPKLWISNKGDGFWEERKMKTSVG